MSRRTFGTSAVAALALAAGLAVGCKTTQTTSNDGEPKAPGAVDDEVHINTFKDEELYTGIDEKLLTFHDGKDSPGSHTSDDDVVFDVTDKDHYDSVMVAQWFKSRKAIMDWCRNQRRSELSMNEKGGNETPPYKRVFDDPKRPETRLDQAIAIAYKILQKVPDSPEIHLRLAQMCFAIGSLHFWIIDAGSWTLLDAQDDPKNEEKQQRAAQVQKTIEMHRKRMIAYHIVALQQFQAFEAAMPMQHPIDFYWKINFQLGNFEQAYKFLKQTLENEDLDATRRAEYERIQEDMERYFVDVRLDDSTPKPGSPERRKKNGGNRSSGSLGGGD